MDDVAAALRLLCRQLVSGTLVDQQFDERQPLRFVDRFGEQFSITRVIESRIHSRAPHLHSPIGLFRNASGRAIRFRFAQCAIHRSMVDDGPSEKSQGSCRRSRRTRRGVIAGGVALLSIDAVRHARATPIWALAWRGPTAPSKLRPAAIPVGTKAGRKDGAR